MSDENEIETHSAETPAMKGPGLSTLVELFGPSVAHEFFKRIDPSLRDEALITGTTASDARSCFSRASRAGCIQIIVPDNEQAITDLSAAVVVINMVDLQAVVRAVDGEFNWARVFAPRSGLEAASTSPQLRRGSVGRRYAQACTPFVKESL